VRAPTAVELADLNADGLDDLIVVNGGANAVEVFLGTGPGQFSNSPRSFAVGTNPVAVVVDRFNGAGAAPLPDLAVVNLGSNDVSVLLGQGRGADWTLVPGQRLRVGAAPNDATAVDFNQDGVKDLLVHNADGSLVLLAGIGSGRGTGFFRDNDAPVIPAPPSGPGPPRRLPVGPIVPLPGRPPVVLRPDGAIDLLSAPQGSPRRVFEASPGRLVTALAAFGNSPFLAAARDATRSPSSGSGRAATSRR
jgi:hypothetical protein